MPLGIKIVVPEDFGIEAFLRTIEFKFVPKVTLYNSVNGIDGVARILIKNRDQVEKFIGFVDNDKTQPKFFDDFVQMETTDNLIFKVHKSYSNLFLVLFNPEFEPFILKLISELKDQTILSSLTIPTNDYKELIKFTKKEGITRNGDFKKLVKTLEKQDELQIPSIIKWVNQVGVDN